MRLNDEGMQPMRIVSSNQSRACGGGGGERAHAHVWVGRCTGGEVELTSCA
jgi:hypothetical protein